jgi:hypothetical protein
VRARTEAVGEGVLVAPGERFRGHLPSV